MSVSEKDLLGLIDEGVQHDIDSAPIPAENEEHVFSEGFEKRMDAFFAQRRESQKKRRRTRRLLIAAAAVITALAATACAVPEVRESIAGFFVKVFGDHVEYAEPAVTKDSIEEEYGLVPVPEGFEVSFKSNNDKSVFTEYTNSENGVITLIQAAKGFSGESVDIEHGDFSEYTLGEKTVRILFDELGAQAAWIQDGYYFSITYPKSVDLTVIEEWIDSVQKP